jgi:tetratricopeptide (TPR) repeat protein
MNYYALSEQWAPLGSVAAARVRFARASMAREAGRNREADSLLEILVADYGLTEYAAEARRQLGYTEAELTDPAKDDYLSGTSFMRIGDNPNAISQFHRVIDRYPSSDYALRSYYAMGLLYERSLEQPDSAFRYYSELLNRYPLSEQAQEVRPIVDAYLQSMTRGGRRGGAAEPPSEQPSAPYNNDPNVTIDPNGVPRFGEGALPLQETPTAPADSSKIPPVERRLPPP